MKILKRVLGALVLSCSWAAGATQLWLEPVTGMPFVALPKGCFQMGSAKPVAPPADTMWNELGYKGSLSDNEKPRHEVCVDAFMLGQYEVRLAEWQQVMGAATGAGAAMPVVQVTWEQAQAFVQRLNQLTNSGQRFRLPTEAEWEYACLAGQAELDTFDFQGKDLVANYGHGSSSEHAHRIAATGMKKANAWGLHDLLGNVWEWAADSYFADGYARHTLHNPRVDTPSDARVIRGGSFRTEAAQVRCTRRGHLPATQALDSLGLRLVREK